MADIEKKVVQLELEVDTKTVDSSKNPYDAKWIHLAQAIDARRISQSIFKCLYIHILFYYLSWTRKSNRTKWFDKYYCWCWCGLSLTLCPHK